MKNTGIVRRIDDLGRVVIPKEIRKTLRIFDGDSIEIYIGQENEIILKKHSELNNLWSFADDYAYCLAKFINNPILIFSKDQVIIAQYILSNTNSNLKNELLNLKVTENLGELLKKKSILKTSAKENNLMFEYPETLKSFTNEFIVPITVNGDLIGGICCISNESLQKNDENLILLASSFIGKHLDN